MELALMVAHLLIQFNPALCRALDHSAKQQQQEQQQPQQHQSQQQRKPFAQKQQADGSHLKRCSEEKGTQINAGDLNGYLPLPETRRQVGIRWPQTRCEVVLQRANI